MCKYIQLWKPVRVSSQMKTNSSKGLKQKSKWKRTDKHELSNSCPPYHCSLSCLLFFYYTIVQTNKQKIATKIPNPRLIPSMSLDLALQVIRSKSLVLASIDQFYFINIHKERIFYI